MRSGDGERLPPSVDDSFGERLPPHKYIALIIGVSQFGKGLSQLPGAERDAFALFLQLRSGKHGYLYEDVEQLQSPTRSQCRESIEKLTDRLQNVPFTSTVLLFLATHGFNVDGEYHLCAKDSSLTDRTPNNTITFRELRDWLQPINSHSVVVILDSCRSQSKTDSQQMPGIDGMHLTGDNWAVWMSASEGQQSWEEIPVSAPETRSDGPHGIFTKELLMELNEPSKSEQEKLNLSVIHQRVSERVRRSVGLSRQGVEQIPCLCWKYADEPSLGIRSHRIVGGYHQREPFRPLQPYTEYDRHYFLGRDDELNGMIGSNAQPGWMLGNHKHHLLMAPSGVGKTSFLRAGAIPRLEEKGHKVFYLDCRVFGSLKEQIAGYLGKATPEAFWEMVSKCEEGLSDREVIFLFDQFESLFHDVAQQEALQWLYEGLEGLRKAPRDMHYRLLFVFRDDCASLLSRQVFLQGAPKLSFVELLGIDRYQWHEISHLTKRAGREILEHAMKGSLLQFSKDLIEEILGELSEDSSFSPRNQSQIYPPSLQLLCQELTRKANQHQGQSVTLSDYESYGRMRGLLGGLLEHTIQGLSPKLRSCAWKVLESLTTRKVFRNPLMEPLLLRRLKSRGWPEEEIRQTLKQLQERRFIIAFQRDGDSIWDLSHEFIGQLLHNKLEEDPEHMGFLEVQDEVTPLRNRLREGKKPALLSLRRALWIKNHLEELCLRELEELESGLKLKQSRSVDEQLALRRRENRKLRALINRSIYTPFFLVVCSIILLVPVVIFVTRPAPPVVRSKKRAVDAGMKGKHLVLQGKKTEKRVEKERVPERRPAPKEQKTPGSFTDYEIRKGEKYYRSGNFRKAEIAYQEACKINKKHCHYIGYLIQHGFIKTSIPEEKRMERAKEKYKKSCDSNSGRGCTLLGELQADKLKKFKLYHKACVDLKDARGCYWLGCFYDRGGPKQNLKKAKMYLKMSCEKSSYTACWKLGRLFYRSGEHEEAFLVYRASCEAHLQNRKKFFGSFCTKLAGMYLNAKGTSKNERRGLELSEKTCLWGYSQSCGSLVRLYRKRKFCKRAKAFCRKNRPSKLDSSHWKVCEKLKYFIVRCEKNGE